VCSFLLNSSIVAFFFIKASPHVATYASISSALVALEMSGRWEVSDEFHPKQFRDLQTLDDVGIDKLNILSTKPEQEKSGKGETGGWADEKSVQIVFNMVLGVTESVSATLSPIFVHARRYFCKYAYVRM